MKIIIKYKLKFEIQVKKILGIYNSYFEYFIYQDLDKLHFFLISDLNQTSLILIISLYCHNQNSKHQSLHQLKVINISVIKSHLNFHTCVKLKLFYWSDMERIFNTLWFSMNNNIALMLSVNLSMYKIEENWKNLKMYQINKIL